MKTKLRPWVIGSVVLMFASTRVAGWERQRHQHSVMEAYQSGQLIFGVDAPPPYPGPQTAYMMILLAVIILVVCAAVLVTRTRDPLSSTRTP